MTLLSADRPAVLGGTALFPEGLPLVRPALGDHTAVAARIGRILASGMLTNGPVVRELESHVAERLGVAHVVAVSSCTSGLALVLQALGATGEVVLPSFTFSASAHAVAWAGGTPVFADVDEATLTLDPDDAAAALAASAAPRALTATHVYGTPCDVQALERVADEAGVPLVFDSAHALGSRHAGRPVGGFGTAEVFSLSPTKVVVGGEGGLVATDDDALARALRFGRDYGNPGDYDCLFPGLNARMSEIHAALALHSLTLLDDALARRRALVSRFWDLVEGLPGLRGPRLAPGDVSTYKDLTLVVDAAAAGLTARELAAGLAAEGIDSRHYYDPPIHRQQAYAHLAPRPLPVTERLAASVVSPPLWSHMDDDQLQRVAVAVQRVVTHASGVRRALDTWTRQ